MEVMEEMTDKELITITIDRYTDLQRIKKENGNQVNKELDYQIKVAKIVLQNFGLDYSELEF